MQFCALFYPYSNFKKGLNMRPNQPKLLDQVRNKIRVKQYSIRTEES